MKIPYKIILPIVFLVSAFLIGRASVKQQTTQEIKVAKTEQLSKDTHTQTTTTTVKEPNGIVKTTTTTDTDTVTKIDKKEDDSTKTTQNVANSKQLNVSALVTLHDMAPVYGISVSKEVIGPFTVGAFGLTSGIVGLSIGINF